ncbi:MAG: ketoacyl-ACP synthase III [Cytophagales bacterium]|nr:ketoacyl-ACP synthase III [Cytophagales bacterium]
MSKIRAAITGVGGYVPEYVLSNQILETMVETNDEWIVSRTGIRERRILKGELGTSYMGEKAVRELLEKTNTDPMDIDLIICATTTPDYIFPPTANLICDLVGAKNAFSYDLQAACSGFIFALHTASQFIETGKYKKAIVVGADKMSSIINYKDRTTCIIFGDGAACVLLEADESGLGVQDAIMKTDGSGYPYLHAKAGGSKHPLTKENIDQGQQYVFQEGAYVFKHAVTNMSDVTNELMTKNNITKDDIKWFVPHQANKRIIMTIADRLGLDESKVLMNIERYGNTTAGTIPLVLWDFEKKFKKGDQLVMTAFGGGFTWGSVYLKWAYDSK